MIINKFETDGEVVILRLSGKLISSTLDGLKNAVDALFEEEKAKIIINFRLVNIIDSVAVGLLISRIKSAKKKEGTLLKFCEIQPAVTKLLMLADSDNWLEIYPTEDEALKSMTAKAS
ncbi:MAG: STAS domain-containing protein [Nitrospinota bacterium]